MAGFIKKEKKAGKSEAERSGTAGIDATIKSIQTKFGENAIMKLGDAPRVGVESLFVYGSGLPVIGTPLTCDCGGGWRLHPAGSRSACCLDSRRS